MVQAGTNIPVSSILKISLDWYPSHTNGTLSFPVTNTFWINISPLFIFKNFSSYPLEALKSLSQFFYKLKCSWLSMWPWNTGLPVLAAFNHWIIKMFSWAQLFKASEVVWCDDSVVYLTSPGHLILAYSWARSAILVAGKGRGGMFLFLLFLRFHFCSSFFPVPHFHLLYYLFSPIPWETTQNDPQGLTCH